MTPDAHDDLRRDIKRCLAESDLRYGGPPAASGAPSCPECKSPAARPLDGTRLQCRACWAEWQPPAAPAALCEPAYEPSRLTGRMSAAPAARPAAARAAPATHPAGNATGRHTATTRTGKRFSDTAEPQQPAPMAATGPPRDGSGLLDDVLAFIRRFVVMSDEQAAAAALWVVHAHAAAAAAATPYLALLSPEKRSGKSRLLEVLAILVPRPLVAANATEAALFRALAERPGPTLLMDEVDTIFGPRAKRENESLRGLLNAGHRRDTPAIRCVGEGSKMRVERFDVFGPKALAGIGDLPDTIADRSIILAMKRRAPGEPVERFRRRDVEPQAAELRAQLARWAEAHLDELAARRPQLPEALDDRAQDAWEPLFAIADQAGGHWPETARAAAAALSANRDTGEEGSLGERLLADMKTVFDVASADRLSSADLVAALVAMESGPWGDLYGRPLDPRQLARRLRPYGIVPKSIRLEDGSTPKGYTADQFHDAWRRYLSRGGDVADGDGDETPHQDSDVAAFADVAANTGVPSKADEDRWDAMASDEVGGGEGDSGGAA